MKGTAWAVPAVAVAAAAPMVAASAPAPPEPDFDFAAGCKNPGGSGKGCGPADSYEVPFTVSNTTTTAQVFQVTSYAIGGVDAGVTGVVADSACGPVVGECPIPSCTVDGVPLTSTNSVCVPPGTVAYTATLVSGSAQNSQSATQRISWQWIDADTCAVIASGSVSADTTTPNCR
jgi:hypothetical protein